jgi:hypothetical protein
MNVVHDALAVNTQLRLRRETRKRERSQTKNQSMIEVATIDFHKLVGREPIAMRFTSATGPLETISHRM